MKKSLISMAAIAALVAGNSASAFWDDDEDWKCWGPMGKIPDCNPYDEWDPRYWMEEMEQVWDDDDDYYRYGGMGGYGPYGAPYGGPMMGAPMGGAPYGYGAPMPMPGPYGAPMPMPAPGYGAPVPPAPPAPIE